MILGMQCAGALVNRVYTDLSLCRSHVKILHPEGLPYPKDSKAGKEARWLQPYVTTTM